MELRWSKKGDRVYPTNIVKIHRFGEILCSILECAAGAEKMVFCRLPHSRYTGAKSSQSRVVLRMAGDGGETTPPMKRFLFQAAKINTPGRKETAVCLFYNSTVCVLDRVFWDKSLASSGQQPDKKVSKLNTFWATFVGENKCTMFSGKQSFAPPATPPKNPVGRVCCIYVFCCIDQATD